LKKSDNPIKPNILTTRKAQLSSCAFFIKFQNEKFQIPNCSELEFGISKIGILLFLFSLEKQKKP
jgi:hypothetical protein